VLLVSGEVRELTPDDPLFAAVCSSFGELAVILEVELQLKRIYSGHLDVLGVSVANFDELFACFEQHQAQADYLVAWVDAFARGAALGRGLVHAAFQLPKDADPLAHRTLQPTAQELPPRLFGIIPKSWMWWLMKPFAHPLGMRLVNAAKYWAGRLLEHGKRYRQSHGAFHFLLDYVPNWKFAYKPGGLIQHQIFVPKAAAREVFAEVFALQQRHGLVTWLAVMKRHRPDRFLFSHGVDGYSMAQDFAVTAANRTRLWAMCHEIEALVVARGGRFYFAKDATVQPETFARSLPAESLQRFAQLRHALDPQGILQTDLYRRVVAPALAAAATDAAPREGQP
jgi:FAD/FMN-containing dehydrogenase